MQTEDYRPNLMLAEILDEIHRLLSRQRQGERLLCRYLADLADHIGEHGSLATGYVGVYEVAAARFGLSRRATRERIRVGRALRDLPAIERALVDGRLAYARAREVTRVATAGDESAWLEAGLALSVRALERRVAEANAARAATELGLATERDASVPPCPVPPSPSVLGELRKTLPLEVCHLLESAMDGARRASDTPLTDAEALAAVARDALAAQQLRAPQAVRTSPTTRRQHAPQHPPRGAGQKLAKPTSCQAARPTGDVLSAANSATHTGSRRASPAASETPLTSEDTAALLEAMRGRSSCHADTLCQASGLSASRVAVALTMLELSGQVERDWAGVITPVP